MRRKYFPKIRANLSADVSSYPAYRPGRYCFRNWQITAFNCFQTFLAVYFKFAGIVWQFGDSKE